MAWATVGLESSAERIADHITPSLGARLWPWAELNERATANRDAAIVGEVFMGEEYARKKGRPGVWLQTASILTTRTTRVILRS
jgi:hypothetical protein